MANILVVVPAVNQGPLVLLRKAVSARDVFSIGEQTLTSGYVLLSDFFFHSYMT